MLGSIIVRNAVLAEVGELSPGDLYSERHRRILRAVYRLRDAGHPINLVSLNVELSNNGGIDAAGGPAYLAELYNGSYPSMDAAGYAQIIREKARMRVLMQNAGALIESAASGDSPARVEEQLEALTSCAQSGGYEWRQVSVADLLRAEPQPIPWLVQGLIARDEVLVLTAPPKSGKTYLLMQVVIDLALGRAALGRYAVAGQRRTLWIDEEMGERKLARRFQRLCKHRNLTDDELDLLDQNIDMRPQQGLSLGSAECFRAYRDALESGKYDLVVMDSIIAMMQGEENSATDRRRFYNEFIAPFKSRYDLAFALTAHPPLPSKDASVESRKRPRGSGDLLAQCDRACWLDKETDEKDTDSHVVTCVLEEIISREGGGLEKQVIVIAGTEDEPVTVRAEGSYTGEGVTAIGRVNACQREILHILRQQPDGRLYQPTLRQSLEDQGFDKNVYYPASNGLEDLARRDQVGIKILDPIKGSGKTGKWVQLVEPGD